MYLEYRELDADIIIIGGEICGLITAMFILERHPDMSILILKNNLQYNKINEKEHGIQFVPSPQKLKNILHDLNIPLNNRDINLNDFSIISEYDKIYTVKEQSNILTFLNVRDYISFKLFVNKITNMMTKISFKNFQDYPEWQYLNKSNMEEFLKENIQSIPVRDVIRQNILITCGMCSYEVSVLFYLALCNSFGLENIFLHQATNLFKFWIQGGAEKVCEKITEKITDDYIREVKNITEISTNNYCVTIKCTEETF